MIADAVPKLVALLEVDHPSVQKEAAASGKWSLPNYMKLVLNMLELFVLLSLVEWYLT